MQKGFMNFAFALFTALLLVGNVFAIIATPYPVIIQKPVITSVEGPTSIAEGQAGTWSVTANDPNRNDLSYAVNWGDGKSLERAGQAESGSIARFLHTYSSAGTYTITFTVTNSQGVQAQTTITVNVQGTVANPCTDSDGGNDLFAKGTGNGDYVGSATPVIIGLGSTPWFAQPSPYSYSVFYDYCDQSGQIIEAFCDANGKLSATGSSCPTGYTCSDGACSSNITAINQPPVITGGSAPESLLVNQQGTWSVSAYDPDGTYLSYSVNWGESIITPSPVEQIKTGSSATFQHTYTQAGTYTITFTVTDSAGAQAQSSTTTRVGASNTCGSDFNQLSVGQLFQVPQMNNIYSVKIIDISADSDRAAIVQILDAKEAVLDNAKIAQGSTYVYSGSNGNVAVTVCKTTGDNTVWIKGSMTSSPSTDKCVGYITLNKGQSLDRGAYQAILSDVTVESGTKKDVAIFEIRDSIGRHVNYQSFYEGSTLMFSENGSIYTVNMKVCQIARGVNGVNWAKLTMNIEQPQNKPPVITGGSTPKSLLVNQQGTWSVSAYDPDGTYLSYSVNWGEISLKQPLEDSTKTGSSATFQHTYTQAGTYTITFTVTDSAGASAQITETVVVGRGINVNQPPVITSVSGSATLSVGNSGNWKVSAYDPDGTYLSYSVNWGEISIKQTLENSINTGNSASFEHTYSQAGTYTITFTVTDSAGAQTESATTVKVVGSASIGEISASVGAIPTELYQYDSVYVTGKVSRGAAATHDLLQSKSYVVVLTLDNGNVVHPETKATSQSGSIMINQGSITIAPSQGKEEEITLAPGESREVSAYFTASQLGTNFAKLMVYEKIGETCTITDEDHAEENGCQNNYKLVASDTVKVQVKQGDIPNPPSEKITLKFEKGWNQISVPTGYDVSLSDIQKKCDITSAWSYNTALGQYSAATVFGREITGVWMKANAACTYEIDAPYVATGSIPLKTGWNMIGAPSQTTAINNFAGNCKITSGPWNYSPSASQYGYSEKLEPGKGYWVKVSSDCTLGIASDNMPPAAPTN